MCNTEKLEYNPVLAMYDIRGKQEFIFRTNKLQEIVGASWIIRDCFNDYLFSAAKKVAEKYNKENGIYSYKFDLLNCLSNSQRQGTVGLSDRPLCKNS